MNFPSPTVERKDLGQLGGDMERDIEFEKYLFKKYTKAKGDHAEAIFKTKQAFYISYLNADKVKIEWFREMFCIGLSDCIRREAAILNRKKKR